MKSKKIRYIFSILCLIFSFAFFQQAYSQRFCDRLDFRDLKLEDRPQTFPEAWHFISIDTLIIFGDNKVKIYHDLRSRKPKSYITFLTTNPGEDPLSEETEKWTCTGVSFVNSKLGYAAATQYEPNPSPPVPYTYRGGIFKTIDGGLSWTKIKGDSSLLTNGFQKFEIRNNIFYALSDGSFIQSTDEGLTWSEIGTPKYKNGTHYAGTFHFIDDTTIIVGGYNTFGKSTDGGKTWINTTKTDCIIRSIIFLGKENGFAVSNDDPICTYKTVDGGEFWYETKFGLPVKQKSSLGYLYKVNDSTAFATGEYMKYTCFYREEGDEEYYSHGFMAKTIDSGKTWKFFYGCPIARWDKTPGLITQSPTFVWALDQPDSSVYILAPGQIFYSGRGGEPNSIENNEIIPAPNFCIYPNPASNQFTIESSEGIKKVLMYDVMGKRVFFKESLLEKVLKIDVKFFPHGIYLLQVETDGGSVTQKVVVE